MRGFQTWTGRGYHCVVEQRTAQSRNVAQCGAQSLIRVDTVTVQMGATRTLTDRRDSPRARQGWRERRCVPHQPSKPASTGAPTLPPSDSTGSVPGTRKRGNSVKSGGRPLPGRDGRVGLHASWLPSGGCCRRRPVRSHFGRLGGAYCGAQRGTSIVAIAFCPADSLLRHSSSTARRPARRRSTRVTRPTRYSVCPEPSAWSEPVSFRPTGIAGNGIS